MAQRRALTPDLWVGCYTNCWGCKFGWHDGKWHTRADGDDIWLWEEGGKQGPSPETKQCGCWCQFYTPKPLIHKGRKPR